MADILSALKALGKELSATRTEPEGDSVVKVLNAIAAELGSDAQDAAAISKAIQNIIPVTPDPEAAGMLAGIIDKSIVEVSNSEVTSIGAGVFQECTSLISADFPEVTSIGQSAFYGCISLTSVDFPEVTSMGSSAFSGCTSLAILDLPEVASIGNNAFGGCTSLTSANFPEVTSIGTNAFSGCTSLTSANFPEVTSIGPFAFSGCTSLAILDLPEVASIGNNAFAGYSGSSSSGPYVIPACTSLETLILRKNEVVTLGSGALTGTPIASGTGYIYVPDDLVDSYKAAQNWSTYAAQIKGISELPAETAET